MNKLVFVLIYLTGVFVSAIAQILLKKSAEKTYDSKIKEYLNPYVIISYSIYLGANFFTKFAYSGIPLSFGPILAASEYIFVAVLSKLILKEKINKKKITGLAIICLGIIVFVMK